MLKKLFKYEWKASARILMVVYGIVILFSILSRLFMEASGINRGEETLPAMETVSALLIMISIVAIFSSVIFTWVFIAYRFYKSVFTEQGYLTNTLPVTQQQIITAKMLTGVIWQVINWVLVLVAVLIMVANGRDLSFIVKGIPDIFRAFVTKDMAATMWLILAAVIISPFCMVLEMYLCVAVGNMLNSHKVLGAVGMYAGLYTIQQVIAIIIMMFSSSRFVETTDSVSAETAEVAYQALNLLNINLIAGVILGLIFTVGGFLITKYIMIKKLNLQ